MNVPEYIQSGILEAYALGSVSDQERREVECLSSIYPEIRQELDQLTEAVEELALEQSVEPPAGLRDAIWNRIAQEDTDNDDDETVVSPVKETRVRPLHVERPVFGRTWLVAASVSLLGLVFAAYLLSQLRSNQNELAKLRADLSQAQGLRRQDQQLLATFRQAGTRTVHMHGNEKAPKADIFVYWNPAKRSVMLETQALPALPEGQQYQLWAMVDGQPVDAGVFDPLAEPQQTGRAIDKAEAFAVTIEKRGGSPVPTLTNLVMMSPVGA